MIICTLSLYPLKHVVVILLLTGMLAQTFNRFFIVVDNQLNKEYIANKLCENKNKPLLQCKGKCQMMKKLQQEEKQDQENPERRSENKFEIISFQHNRISIIPLIPFSCFAYPEYRENYSSAFLAPPFHPPCV